LVEGTRPATGGIERASPVVEGFEAFDIATSATTIYLLDVGQL
jgi:hypothetical protein